MDKVSIKYQTPNMLSLMQEKCSISPNTQKRTSTVRKTIIIKKKKVKMEADKMHIRHCMLHYFHRDQNAAETTKVICDTYGEDVLAESSCREWFHRFKNGNFDLKDKERSGLPQEIKTDALKMLLRKDSTISSIKLAKQLHINHSSVLRRLRALGMIHKEGRWVSCKLSDP